MDKITTVIAKEWAEVFKNKLVLFSVLFLPLILAAIPLVMLFVFRQASGSMSAELNDPEIMELPGAMHGPVGGRLHHRLHAQPVRADVHDPARGHPGDDCRL